MSCATKNLITSLVVNQFFQHNVFQSIQIQTKDLREQDQRTIQPYVIKVGQKLSLSCFFQVPLKIQI
jgi:hypothetical protein